MAKWTVQVFGRLPDCVTVEAEAQDEAEELALDKVMEDLDFVAELEEIGEEASPNG
jgi:hypothetical protein